MAFKENYRELLLDAVVRVAARDGLDRTTTKLIAAEVPCNEVYIYRNFGSKDGLLQAAFNRTDMRFVQTVLKNLDVMDKPGQPLEQRCRALWEPVWRFCLAQPDDTRFYLRYYYSAQFLASAHELHHRNYQQLQARLSRYFVSSHDSWLLMAHIFETILSFVSRCSLRRSARHARTGRASLQPHLPHAAALYAAMNFRHEFSKKHLTFSDILL